MSDKNTPSPTTPSPTPPSPTTPAARIIRQLRTKMGLTLADVAKYLGVQEATVQRYESGKIKHIKYDTVCRLAELFDCDPAYILGWESEDVELLRKFDNIFPIETVRVPFLGEIACGEPIYAAEEHESFVLAGSDINADFCLRAHGDSMINARIFDGDIVFVRRQDMVDNGEIAVVIIGDEATLKRVYYHRDKNLLILRPENPAYQDMIFTGGELDTVKILGRAIAFQSDVR